LYVFPKQGFFRNDPGEGSSLWLPQSLLAGSLRIPPPPSRLMGEGEEGSAGQFCSGQLPRYGPFRNELLPVDIFLCVCSSSIDFHSGGGAWWLGQGSQGLAKPHLGPWSIHQPLFPPFPPFTVSGMGCHPPSPTNPVVAGVFDWGGGGAGRSWDPPPPPSARILPPAAGAGPG